MDVRIRVAKSRLLEKTKRDPEYAELLGVDGYLIGTKILKPENLKEVNDEKNKK